MNNIEIIKILKQTASLLELYGENQFKVRSYQTAVYNLERTTLELGQLDQKQLAELPGVGKSIASTIEEINQTGESSTLENLLKQTPEGILELISIKGIGAKKIKTAWDLLGVESVEDLFFMAKQGKLAELSGFGTKTQERILQIISFHLSNQGLIHYKEAHNLGIEFEQQVILEFPEVTLSRVGSFRRKVEIVHSLQYLWANDQMAKVTEFFNRLDYLRVDPHRSGPMRWVGTIREAQIRLDVRFCSTEEYGNKLVYYTGSTKHLLVTNKEGKCLRDFIKQPYSSEEAVYKELGWPMILPELREGMYENDYVEPESAANILETGDLKGILHNHSTYSDGKNSVEAMAKACMDLGYEYFGISDHSQTAVYANGLNEERVAAQHLEIDKLNQELAPFKILKGIESDILNDGQLDYPDSVLASFDFVVASIHFNLNMDIDQATNRLIKAIENPYTTILGHPTGRQLLKREGYPVHHRKVIDACAKNQVVIELNAHPWRLDLDWRWIRYAVDQGVFISINPDAHEVAGIKDVLYGVNVSRKAGLTREMTFNAKSLKEMDQYLSKRISRMRTSTKA